jgi:replicative DNA helicase
VEQAANVAEYQTIDDVRVDEDADHTPFGKYQEEAIISLALDHPEFFINVGRYLKPDMFGRQECKYVIAVLLNYYEKYRIIPTRLLIRDIIEKELTPEQPFDIVFKIIDRKSDPREVPIIKDTLMKWAKTKAYGLIYSEDAIRAYESGRFDEIEKIVQEANKVTDIGEGGFWLLEQYEKLFQSDAIDHRTTGFPRLDRILNNGGPSPKEVVCWLAPTNTGKSILLVNNAIASLKGLNSDGTSGQDVLLVTFELDTIKTALRCLSTTTGIAQDQVPNNQDYIRRVINTMKDTYKRRLLIYEFPPDECSVDHIYALIDNLKRKEGWKPDVVIIDYLDLMVSRNAPYNSDDYTRQKHVATELRGLAKNENVLVFTATQTNRSGGEGGQPIDLSKTAESYGKQFALDYVISLNQSLEDKLERPPRIRFYVAKNRNGPKNEMITCEINYDTMVVKEMA